jgi:hypothetical protein
MNVGLNER